MSAHNPQTQAGTVARGLLAACGFALGGYITLVIIQPMVFENRFGYGSAIAGISVSLKTASEAEDIVAEEWKRYSKSEVDFSGQSIPVTALVKEIDINRTIDEALVDEERHYFGLSKYSGKSHSTKLVYNDDEISAQLSQLYDEVATVPADAVIADIDAGVVESEKSGIRLLLAESRMNIYDSLTRFESIIGPRTEQLEPGLTKTAAEALITSVRASIATPVQVKGDNYSESISAASLKEWLKLSPISSQTLVANDTLLPDNDDDYYYLDQAKLYQYASMIAEKVNQKAANAVLGMNGGALVVVQASVIGQELNKNKLIADIEDAVKSDHSVNLSVSVIQPEVTEKNLGQLGITELISEGWSDAAGSPANRIHNFKTGTSKFNGVLIKPDEEVSFNKILGPVDASTGYVQELVILADKTVPEYGGGLCQVSSTAFRAALNAGLPILERHNHAYPVVYYRPYGVDATIYLPTPDLRFKNDTGHYILIQTSVVGTKVYFDFYGTKKPGKTVFSGSASPVNEVSVVEQVTPTITDVNARGPKSFTATFYRHIYDAAGKLTDNDKFTSRYDTPDKYPH